jgi:hypothetical protein
LRDADWVGDIGHGQTTVKGRGQAT